MPVQMWLDTSINDSKYVLFFFTSMLDMSVYNKTETKYNIHKLNSKKSLKIQKG